MDTHGISERFATIPTSVSDGITLHVLGTGVFAERDVDCVTLSVGDDTELILSAFRTLSGSGDNQHTGLATIQHPTGDYRAVLVYNNNGDALTWGTNFHVYPMDDVEDEVASARAA